MHPAHNLAVMRRLLPRAAVPSIFTWPAPAIRQLATCAEQLRPQEDAICHGLRGRLSGLQQESGGQLRIAVAGRHSADFAAAMRAVRREGASAAPVDATGLGVEELAEFFAEAQVHLTVVAGASPGEEHFVREAARRLGMSMASAADLRAEGAGTLASAGAAAQAGLLLFATTPSLGSSMPRAVEVPKSAVDSRLSAAIAAWGLDKKDTVLSLGLHAGEAASVVDALEAPLESGASIALPENASSVWDLWAALHAESEATVAFISSGWCWRLVEAYGSLAPALRAEFATRWAKRPLRHFVALAPAGSVLSEDLAQQWQEVFRCPLTWHFSCAEVGSLYTVRQSEAVPHLGHCSNGLEWRVEEGGDLRVRGEGLFKAYHSRPRSTAEAFDEDGFFCQTGHRVLPIEDDAVLPLPRVSDLELEKEMWRHLTKEPNVESWPGMRPSWSIKKVPMRVYEKWRAAWGGLLYTKKHNQANKVYQSKYK
eukprot:TRINITY_DN94816_c0_g1_i1.p1 TRINITY_DN94816_c0_g1~~TRINITY_DN94816_c0_g1_i1.p1  ORF type:complete len:482 (+),score=98.24 TRINITY_DN94816_c0_g1_i1:152-1597(+)